MSILSFNVISDEVSADNSLPKADSEILSQIHDYCSEQYFEESEVSIDKQILECINNELYAVGYRKINSLPKALPKDLG